MVSPVEAEQLALATREGKVDVVLRSGTDREIADTPGATVVKMLGDTAKSASAPKARLAPAIYKVGKRTR